MNEIFNTVLRSIPPTTDVPNRSARPSLADEQEVRDARNQHEAKEGVAAEGRDIALGFFQPRWANRVCRMTGRPEREQDGLIEAARVAFDNLLGKKAKGQSEQTRNEKADDWRHFRDLHAYHTNSGQPLLKIVRQGHGPASRGHRNSFEWPAGTRLAESR